MPIVLVDWSDIREQKTTYGIASFSRTTRSFCYSL
ncbi:hypothetical protein SEEA9517_04359, partial [Salmonella enterica subsp. enterica serovar Agona str. 400095 17]